MQSIRKRLTYANVVASLALFLALGGATAFAATQLARNSVGAKQLKRNSVTAAKLKKNAVTTKKIKNGAVTGPKVKVATLGTVPSAKTLTGYARKGLTKVVASAAGASFEASEAAAPEIPLFSAGAFTIYAKCFDFGGETNGAVFIKTSENGAILESDFVTIDGEPFLDTTTPETQREVLFESDNENDADYFGGPFTEFAAMAPGGTAIRGDVQIAVKNGTLAGGNGIYGDGDVCLFAGEVTALNG